MFFFICLFVSRTWEKYSLLITKEKKKKHRKKHAYLILIKSITAGPKF